MNMRVIVASDLEYDRNAISEAVTRRGAIADEIKMFRIPVEENPRGSIYYSPTAGMGPDYRLFSLYANPEWRGPNNTCVGAIIIVSNLETWRPYIREAQKLLSYASIQPIVSQAAPGAEETIRWVEANLAQLRL